MRYPLILSGMAALLLAQIPWPTGMALGQGAGTAGAAVATPMNAACDRDLQQFCSGVQPGQGRLIQCLNGRKSDLSEACRTFVLLAQQGCAPEVDRTVRCIKPSDTDPAIKRFDRLHYVLFNQTILPTANLLVFLPGTFGKPPGPTAFLHAAADAGYRVISLDYNDEPAVNVYCPRKPPACSSNFRRMRIYGDGVSIDPSFDNSTEESIVNRLVKLLMYLDRADPRQGWGGYLDNGMPNWSRIAFTGQSQGAGMAAYVAKGHALARVILFSSPWDFVTSNGKLQMMAPWLATPAATPAERWFGAYHQRKNQADLLAKSFAALRIPPQNIRAYKGDLAASHKPGEDNPFHFEALSNPAYAGDRAFLLGRSP
jgi:Cysteine rich repeat